MGQKRYNSWIPGRRGGWGVGEGGGLWKGYGEQEGAGLELREGRANLKSAWQLNNNDCVNV